MASGRPDWYSSIAMHGKHLTDYVCVAVDAAGNMLGIMQGWDGAALQPIAVDAAGVMKANLVLQDLSFLTVRPAYGSAIGVESYDVIPDSVETTVFSVVGQGVIYDGLLWTDCSGLPGNVSVRLYVDDNLFIDTLVSNLYNFKAYQGTPFKLILAQYNTVTDDYTIMFNAPITFESQFEVRIYQNTGVNVDFIPIISYALTP